MEAVTRGQDYMVPLLLRSKADMSLRNSDGQSCLELCQSDHTAALLHGVKDTGAPVIVSGTDTLLSTDVNGPGADGRDRHAADSHEDPPDPRELTAPSLGTPSPVKGGSKSLVITWDDQLQDRSSVLDCVSTGRAPLTRCCPESCTSCGWTTHWRTGAHALLSSSPG